jgi:hypothetical protein
MPDLKKIAIFQSNHIIIILMEINCYNHNCLKTGIQYSTNIFYWFNVKLSFTKAAKY